MSPDASVHEDQMDEIEAQRDLRKRTRRRVRRSRNKSCCCAVGCVIPILLLVGLIGYVLLFLDFNEDNYYRPGENTGVEQPVEPQVEDGDSGVIGKLRSTAESAKERMDMLKEPGAFDMRLNELRGKVSSDSEATSLSLKSQLEKATNQLEALREKVREKGENAPELIEQMKALRDRVSSIEGAMDGSTSETQSTETPKGGE